MSSITYSSLGVIYVSTRHVTVSTFENNGNGVTKILFTTGLVHEPIHTLIIIKKVYDNFRSKLRFIPILNYDSENHHKNDICFIFVSVYTSSL